MAAKYVKTKDAVDAYDRAWKRVERAKTARAVETALKSVVYAERKVSECWAEEAQIYADARTALTIRELNMPKCPSDWRFLRDVVLQISA